MTTQKYLNDLTYTLIGCAIEVHRELGPGLLESIYHKCFLNELFNKQLQFSSHLNVPIVYKGQFLDTELRLDVLVEDILVVELKAVEIMHPLYEAQLLHT